ncbi:MAG: hypothetical protein ACPGWR_18440 [Ardenticatenaceae bacterium]
MGNDLTTLFLTDSVAKKWHADNADLTDLRRSELIFLLAGGEEKWGSCLIAISKRLVVYYYK